MKPTKLGASPCPLRSSIALALPIYLACSYGAICAGCALAPAPEELSSAPSEAAPDERDDAHEQDESEPKEAEARMRDAGVTRRTTHALDAIVASSSATDAWTSQPIADGTIGDAAPSAPEGDGAADIGPPTGAATSPTPPGRASTPPDASTGVAVLDVDAGLAPASCHLAGNQIAVMGDSYLDLSGNVTRYLQQFAREAGALGPTESYIDQARTGASMAYAPTIPSQLQGVLATARDRRSAGVKLVIMTGGGNDMLIYNTSCMNVAQPTDSCKQVVQQTVRLLKKLFIDMAAAGIEDVVYFGYPNLPGGGLGGLRPQVMNGYAMPILREACESNTEVRCHFVDTRPTFDGHPEYISAVDRVHPSEAGSRAIAALVWSEMQTECLGATNLTQ